MQPAHSSEARRQPSDVETRASTVDTVPPGSAAPGQVTSESSLSFASATQATPGTLGSSAAVFTTPPADSFPGYKVVREIHRGGQGVVYQAIQESTRRRVAIKVMKDGPFAGVGDHARFEREVHILGQLNHPNIVAIHESGLAAGHYYFVMDYISGQPLDQYVQKARLSLEDTLRLFARVCDGVNAAHVRGVIHRDLKPSNIRVDTEGEPHVLDFGLAKTMAGDAESACMTMTGQFLGSLPWASPEQAEAVPSKIDLRSDVYSLGVVLYQMLTGRFPYDIAGSMRDILDRILRSEPARPSTIRKQINNEIETIVLKCLAKERDRRYQSAGELGRDIGRYLSGQPIEAKCDSAWYVLSKTLRRHRAPTAFGAALLVVIVGFSIAMSFAYESAHRAAQRAETVATFLDGVLTSVDPEIAQTYVNSPLHAALRQTADQTAQSIDKLGSEPEIQARTRTALGHTYLNLGLYTEARAHLARATELAQETFGARDRRTADAQTLLAWALKEQGEFPAAEQAYLEALAVRQAVDGERSLAVADSLNGLGQLSYAQRKYAAAENYHRRALELRQQLGAPERDVASSLANLGSVLRDADRIAEAEPLLLNALEMRRRLFGDAHFHTVVSMNKLGLLLRQKGDFAAARQILEEALPYRRALLGRHPHVAVSLCNLGLVLCDEGRYTEAVPRFEEAITLWQETLSPENKNVGQGLIGLATALRGAGQRAQALEHCREALEMKAIKGVERGQGLYLLGELYLDDGNPQVAAEHLRDAVQSLQAELGDNHRSTALASSALGDCLVSLGRFDEAEPLLLNSYERIQGVFGPTRREPELALQRIVRLYDGWGRPEDAARYRALLSIRENP